MGRLIDASLIFDAPRLRAERDRVTRLHLAAARGAVAEVTKDAERKLEALTRAAVPGRLWRAWKSEVHPKSGLAREPVGTIFVNGGSRSRGAISFFTIPGRIQAKGGGYLAIPLPAAGARGRSRDLTPGEWERRTGIRLRYVYRPGKPALLVADAGTTNARTGAFRAITRARTAADERRGFQRGAQTVPIFVLVQQVAHKPSVSIAGALAGYEGRLVRAFEERIGRADRVAD